MNFLQDDHGNQSSMRLMCIISLFAAIVFAYLTLTIPSENQQTGILITFGFLTSAFAPKALQKYIETNIGNKRL